MHLLFIHRAFPAQFGRLALELTQRYGWKCTFLVEHLSRCPTPSPAMLEQLTLHPLPRAAEAGQRKGTPWPQQYGQAMQLAQTVFEAVRTRPALRPDLVVGHGGLVPTLFLRDLLSCPIVDYCEYYFAPQRRDLTYRIDLPAVEPAAYFPRCINAAMLVNLVAADAAYCPTHWQRQSFPARFHGKIEVHFDGLDTELYRPRTDLPRTVAGRSLPDGTRVVTFVARGLESMRGFDLFMQVADRIARQRPDVVFVIAGDEEVYYGWDQMRSGAQTFKQWVLQRGQYDLERFIFVGQVEPERLAEVLALSDLHVYLSVPFVLSWSLFDALACGCVVLAGDIAPVRELIEPGKNGLLEPLFDINRLAETALRVLADPAQHAPLGREARRRVEAQYGLETTVPELKEFLERVAAR